MVSAAAIRVPSVFCGRSPGPAAIAVFLPEIGGAGTPGSVLSSNLLGASSAALGCVLRHLRSAHSIRRCVSPPRCARRSDSERGLRSVEVVMLSGAEPLIAAQDD